MATSLATLRARCAELGCELIAEGHAADLEVLAPRGRRFAGTDLHMLRLNTFNNHSWRMGEAYEVMLSDLAAGVEPCDDPACDYCTGEEA